MFGVQRSDGTLRLFWCTEKQLSMVHWASNRRKVGRPCTISRGPDEDGSQDQGEEDQQPSIVRRQHPQGQHGGGGGDRAGAQRCHNLDETGMPCVCIGVGLLGVLLDLPERV